MHFEEYDLPSAGVAVSVDVEHMDPVGDGLKAEEHGMGDAVAIGVSEHLSC